MESSIYHPPEADLGNQTGTEGAANFKRFSAWGVFGLTIITFGLYPIYWLYTRAQVINGFHSTKISLPLLQAFLVFVIASLALEITAAVLSENEFIAIVNGVVSIVQVVLYLVVLFTVRNRLVEILGRDIGPVLTFFAASIYLQYKINETIDETTDEANVQA